MFIFIFFLIFMPQGKHGEVGKSVIFWGLNLLEKKEILKVA